MRQRVRLHSWTAPYLLVLPAIALLLIFKVYPIITSIWGSLYTRKGTEFIFVALKNYSNLFDSAAFWRSLKTTGVFNLWVVPTQLLLALVLALMLYSNPRGGIVFRSVFFINIGISLATASTIWGLMMDASNGIINSMLAAIGIAKQPFLTHKSQAMGCLIVICCWKGFSYWMLIMMSSLQSIPRSIYEAARLDGSSGLHTIWNISLPLIRPTLTFCLVSCTSINLMVFTPMYALTNGGPSKSTNVLMLNAYVTLFQNSDRGSAYAMITILMVVCFLIVSVQMRGMRRK